ncbi:MAG: histidine phosphatase family protein [Firmicutes bacterium HGW-Firmicutes-1]|jgi:probable phosphoglycerate mutase|nr:MAG: histidine phosphatase family protein [Firmicutes bacterium HGW-Firmicutes-1]
MGKIFLTRHGETIWNTERRMQGHNNSPLSELGMKQAEWLFDKLKDEQIDVVLSSPLGRAIQTSEVLIANRKLEVITVDELKEINLGCWEGCISEVVEKDFPVEYHSFWNEPEKYVPIDGESFLQLNERVTFFLNNVLVHYKNKNILIVAHAVVIKALLNAIETNGEISRLWEGSHIFPTSLSTLSYENDDIRINSIGDISHYKEQLKRGWFAEEELEK